jgi:hypothetical protein
MAIYAIPPDTLRDLLINIEGEIYAASPFAFLLAEGTTGDLEPHLPWLKEHGLLATPARREGRVVLSPGLRRSLDIVAHPIRRIVISEVLPAGRARSVHVSNGAEVVVAAFDEENCILSDPVGLEAFRDGLASAVEGSLARGKRAKPYQFPPEVLALLGAASGPWSPSEKLAATVEGLNSALEWPMARQAAQARLAMLLDDADSAAQALDSLVEDNILSATNGKLDIHPGFRVYHRAIASGDFFEIRREEIPGGDLTRIRAPVNGMFVGAAGQRVLIWPAGEGSKEVVLAVPTAEDLKSLIGYLVGWLDD